MADDVTNQRLCAVCRAPMKSWELIELTAEDFVKAGIAVLDAEGRNVVEAAAGRYQGYYCSIRPEHDQLFERVD